MNEVQERPRRNAMQLNHPLQRRAEALVVVVMNRLGGGLVNLHMIGDESHNSLLHLAVQADRTRIERVVEIEHPGIHMRENVAQGARRFACLPGGDVAHSSRTAPNRAER